VSELDKDIDDHLDGISAALGTIKARSQEMNTSLRDQNRRLDLLVPKTDSQVEAIRRQQRDVKKL
jgi:hypothetical protein